MKHVDIDGVEVAIERRDISQVSDKEMARIRAIVEREKDADYARTLKEVVIESDYVDGDSVRYRTSTLVTYFPIDDEPVEQ